jgi:hypothetical protein
MASRMRPAGLAVCGMIALWLGWLDLDRRLTEAENNASDASYAASDALQRLDSISGQRGY